MSSSRSVQIVPMGTEHIRQVARLHLTGISDGFLSSLGQSFLCCLYRAVADSENAFGFVALDNAEVVGFVSCTESIGALYKTVLKKDFHKLLWACLPAMLRLKNIKHALETLCYPMRTEEDLPSAELLSIVVAREARGLGLGRKLVQVCWDEFSKRGVETFKVMVYDKFPSNRFYERVGFTLAGKYCQHGGKDVHNTYVLQVVARGGN